MALLGDSDALYMFPGFAKSFADAGVAIMMIGQSSCAPILGVRAFLKGTREQCSSANQLMVERLATSTSLRTVILSSLGPYYFSGKSFASDHAGSPMPRTGSSSRPALHQHSRSSSCLKTAIRRRSHGSSLQASR